MRTGLVLSPILMACVYLVGCSANTPDQVSYSRDVRPILDSYCAECHTPGNSEHPIGVGYVYNQLSTETYESLMRGTKWGPVIKPGDAANSIIVSVVEGKADPRLKMPHGRGPLPEHDATIIHNWVTQGAKNN